MPLAALTRAWSGAAYRHLPRGSRNDVLNFRLAGRGPDNRWNDAGQPTLYLAGDPAVAALEFFRHLGDVRDVAVIPQIFERDLDRLTLALTTVVDLRAPD